MVLPTHRLTDT